MQLTLDRERTLGAAGFVTGIAFTILLMVAPFAFKMSPLTARWLFGPIFVLMLISGGVWVHAKFVRDRPSAASDTILLFVVIALLVAAAIGVCIVAPLPEDALQLIVALLKPKAVDPNVKLRQAVIEYAAKMRDFENNAERNEPSEPPLGKNPEDWERIRQEYIRKVHAWDEDERTEFDNQFLGQARTFRNDLLRRLREAGIFPPYFDGIDRLMEVEATHALDTGSLAGPYPVATTANYLESLARKLPDR